MRPISIVRFERCYLAAILVGIVNSLLIFPTLLHSPQTAQAVSLMGPGILYVSLGLGILIPLALWYFAARRASTVAKWIVVVFFALGVLGIIRNLVVGFPHGLSGVLGIVAFVLQAVAVSLLFRPDAAAWFARRGDDLGSTFR